MKIVRWLYAPCDTLESEKRWRAMKTILVDDMLLDMRLFELKVKDVPDFEIVGKFKTPWKPLHTQRAT